MIVTDPLLYHLPVEELGHQITVILIRLIGRLPLETDPNFALTHAKSFHPFLALPCVEPHSKEE